MKKTNNVQETGNKKIRKAFIAIICFALISITVGAKDNRNSFTTNDSKARLANLKSDLGSESTALYAMEGPLAISHSSEVAFVKPAITVETAKEKSLEIESWMTETKYFLQTVQSADEKEQPLKVEEWMINEHNFSSSQSAFADATEENMKIESWMTDEHFWGKR